MNYKEIIESRYYRKNWQLLLHDIFGCKIEFWSTPSVVATNSPFAKQALWLGKITLSDEQTIAVYEVELADSVDIERNRRGIRDMLLTAWRNNGNAGAFMFCYRKNESVLRFSYVSESWKFADDGSYQKESTDTRRFTYLLGEGHRSRTAIQQFEHLRDSNLSLKDLTKAFSVDAVSDMFFDGYKKQYENIIFYVTGKRMVKVANKWEERLEGKPCETIMQQFARFPNPEKSIRDYVKKLMGRLVFLQFLQKKGWLGVPANAAWGEGDTEFIQNIFAQCDDKDHFVYNVLELLFDDLNSENEKKLPQYRTPYLNGGLFERDATDDTSFPLPAQYTQSLLDFFASYNFTIDENDPDDAEVGVDPEMLGRIFENLLEDNKDKGAFYTPKEIVSYMCRESLIAYLQTGIEDEPTKEAIRQFVTTHQVQEHLPENTDQLLKDVKICDPAIGSGAFPMGLLKELFLCRTALEGISQHQAAEIKKHIIQQNVYGVDIERGAVDIARLRFWLSLIVDEETPQALPNLDFKIMQGNSLIESYGGFDLSRIGGKTVGRPSTSTQYVIGLDSDLSQKNLQRQLREYFSVTDHQKKATRRHAINAEVKTLIRESVGGTPTFLAKLEQLDPSANQDFFLWHTWFHDVFSKGGFDIVIGNPPYKIVSSDDVNKDFFDNHYKVAHGGKRNLYHLFFERGLSIAKTSAILSYITPDTYFSGNDTVSLRKLLVEETCIRNIVHYSENDKVFENVTQAVAVIVLSKRKGDCAFCITIDGKDILINYKDLSNANKYVFKSANSVITKMNESRTKFDDYCIGYKGDVNLGLKKQYFSTTKTFASLPLIRGVQLSRFGYNPGNEYCSVYALTKNHTDMERVVIQEVANMGLAHRVKGTILKKVICGDTCNILFPKDNRINIYYLLGIVNSKAVNYYFKYYNQTNHVPIGEIKRIPFPDVDSNRQQPIIYMVKQILEKKRLNPNADTSASEQEIDRLVYKLYNLTDEEIEIVEGR